MWEQSGQHIIRLEFKKSKKKTAKQKCKQKRSKKDKRQNQQATRLRLAKQQAKRQKQEEEATRKKQEEEAAQQAKRQKQDEEATRKKQEEQATQKKRATRKKKQKDTQKKKRKDTRKKQNSAKRKKQAEATRLAEQHATKRKKKAKQTGVVKICGLQNTGNSCYANAVLQCILNTPLLAKNIREPTDCCGKKIDCPNTLLTSLQKLQEEISSAVLSRAPSIRPSTFMKCVFECLGSFFGENLQEDAGEFTLKFLEKLNDTSHERRPWKTQYVNENSKEEVRKGSVCVDSMCQSGFDHCLQFAMQNRVWNSCNCTSIKWEESKMLTVEIRREEDQKIKRKKDTNVAEKFLIDLLTNFFKEESLAGNEWKCPKKCPLGESKRELSLWNTPPVLIINVKRFAYDTITQTSDRLSDPVVAPLDQLDMSPYVAQYSPHKEAKKHYSLRAFVVHLGSVRGGHYISYVRTQDNIWHECNDSRIITIEISDIVEKVKRAYILFYER